MNLTAAQPNNYFSPRSRMDRAVQASPARPSRGSDGLGDPDEMTKAINVRMKMGQIFPDIRPPRKSQKYYLDSSYLNPNI
jgi:hypothetical protein